MARNKLAGTTKGNSKSALYYQRNPEARKKKDNYNKKFHSSKERRMYRSKLNKFNRKNGKVGDDKDASHCKDGSIVLEGASQNRARNRGKK
jgi:hypothetical protein